jgi:hypothetical protein
MWGGHQTSYIYVFIYARTSYIYVFIYARTYECLHRRYLNYEFAV